MGRGYPRQVIIRLSKTVVVILKLHSSANIKLKLAVTTMAIVEDKNNILASIGVDREFVDCKCSVEAKTECSLAVETGNTPTTDRKIVNNDHLQSSLSSLRNEDDLAIPLI